MKLESNSAKKMSNIFDNIPAVTIDFSKPIDTEELLAKLEDIDNEFHKRQLQRVKDAKAYWDNLTLEKAEKLLLDIEENPKDYRTMIFDDGFYKYYPPFSIIILKKALKEFIEMKKK